MRKGDIIVNPWVSRYFNGELNPNYATIYLGDNKSLDYTGKVCGWADKVYKDNSDRMTPWKVIGHIDLYGIAELAIRDAVFDEENERGYGTMNEADRKTEPTISKMEQVEDEPQTKCQKCKSFQYNGWYCVAKANGYPCHYEPKGEPQTERSE